MFYRPLFMLSSAVVWVLAPKKVNFERSSLLLRVPSVYGKHKHIQPAHLS